MPLNEIEAETLAIMAGKWEGSVRAVHLDEAIRFLREQFTTSRSNLELRVMSYAITNALIQFLGAGGRVEFVDPA